MELRKLKNIRVAISVIAAVAVAAVFLDLRGTIAGPLSTYILPTQLVPAITKSLEGWGAWTVGIALILLLTLAFGRVYCSTLCPLGFLQDIVIHIRGGQRPRPRYRYSKPNYGVHYGVLAATVVVYLAGSLVLLNLVEPFSNAGRILDVVLRPLLGAVNNGTAWLVGMAGFYTFSPVAIHMPEIGVLVGTLLFLAFIVGLSYRRGRMFCNLLCPAGAILGLASRFSAYRIAIDRTTCTDCGLCEKVCKAECIDADSKKVDFAACVGCYNCISSCPTVGLTFVGLRSGRANNDQVDLGRRQFLAGTVVVVADSMRDTTTLVLPGGPRPKGAPVTPPGSIGLDHFSSRCTACHACVSTCPTQVLRPAFLEYGVGGIFQPRMDFNTNYCNYDCVLCTTVCPSGAILPLQPEDKKLTQIGKTKFVKEDCIVEVRKKDCGACSEHCPTKAVSMKPYGALLLPELNNDLCIGCGACEHACPTVPRKAIYVESSAVHGRAKKPVKGLDAPVQQPVEEFPF